MRNHTIMPDTFLIEKRIFLNDEKLNDTSYNIIKNCNIFFLSEYQLLICSIIIYIIIYIKREREIIIYIYINYADITLRD